ncbi:hypothetical protein BROUX41_002706 [Berkeleyomyces rouxiae]|uniref:uncharacterized protein n=1 Tax=Berkeleyomyces rouxiae TaxID=2035830 RepID=UPI003B7D4EE9
MPVPFEALIPYGIITVMFGVTGAGLGAVKYWQNGWKAPRWALDDWDRQSTMKSILYSQHLRSIDPRPSSMTPTY